MTSGAEVISDGGQIGLNPGFTYYVVVVDATHFRLAPTQFDAAIAPAHDPADPLSGRIIDLQAGVDFDPAHPEQVLLGRYDYTAQPDNDPNPIAGVPSAWRSGNYDPDFVYEMPLAEQNAIIASRVRQATEMANPISATLRRFLYPGSFVISGFDPGASNETLNVLAHSLTLEVNDADLAVNPPTGRVGTLLPQQTLLMEYGINGTASHASLLTQEQKELLGSAIIHDVVGIQYVTYRYLGSTANYDFQSATHDFSDAALWERVEPDYITSVDTGVVSITTGQTVLVEIDKANYGWYKFLGTDRSISLATQNYKDFSLWQPVVIDVETQATLRLVGDDPTTIKTVVLNNGNLVADTETIDRLTIQVVDDVNIELDSAGQLQVTARGDVALQAVGDVNVQEVITPGDVRLSATGKIIDQSTSGAAIVSLGNVNLEAEVVQKSLGVPLQTLIGPSGSLSGATTGAFRVVQGSGSRTIAGSSHTFGDLAVPFLFGGGEVEITVQDGDLLLGQLESNTGFVFDAAVRSSTTAIQARRMIGI